MTNPSDLTRQPVEGAPADLTPEEIAAVRAALASVKAGAGSAAPTAPWLAVNPASSASGSAAVAGGLQNVASAEPPIAPWLAAMPVAPGNVVPVATTGVNIREGMRRRPPLAGRRRADALPTRALAAAAGVAVTLGLVVVLVPPDGMVATGAAGSGDTGSDPSSSADQGVANVSPSDVVESGAPSPVPAASKAAKAKATAAAAAATSKAKPRATTSGSSRGSSGGSSGGSSSASKGGSTGGSSSGGSSGGSATPAPTQAPHPTPAPTAAATPRPTPVVTPPPPPPPPPPTPVPTAASGKP